MAAVGLGLAGSATAAAPSPQTYPTEVVKQLEAKGYKVIVTTVSGGGATDCSISAVRHGQTVMGKNKEIHGVQTPVAPHKTMYVDLRC
ncbi:MAG: hypothetical protein ACSLE6_13655 [Mycobacterium sp.]